MDDEGRIDVVLNVRKALPELPAEEAPGEYSIGPGAFDCPPMNIVIFIVGSRGEIPLQYRAAAVRTADDVQATCSPTLPSPSA
jgi:hypothetical protein